MSAIPGAGLLSADTIKYVLIAAAVVGGGIILTKAMHNSDQSQTQNVLDSSPEAQQANDLLKLLHPVTYKQFSLVDTLFHPLTAFDALHDKLAIVDKTAIIAMGQGITNLDLVSSNYKKLSKDTLNLTDDLRSTLSADQLKQFYQWINIKNANSSKTKAAFTVYANPTGAQKTTVIFSDSLLKKPLVGYQPGVALGKVSKAVTVPYKGSTGVITQLKLYYITMSTGQYKGQNVYVLVSQTTNKKPQ
jgi:hypothetical protein